MKAPRNFVNRYLLLPVLALGLAGCDTLQEVPDSDTYIFLDPEATLYVRFTLAPDLALENRFPDLADTIEERRYEQFYASMRSLAQLYRFPMDMHLLEKFETPGDGPVLDLFAIRWEQDQMGEINAVLRARLEKYGHLNTLGTFKQREMPSVMSNYERTEQVYARTMEDALSQMFVELNNHFETAAEEAYVEGVPSVGSEP
ncbi:hypothetical protein [Pelagicoccus enzymogenes]|uniref:hypothetical protein n=1 Tax=Pelagicoccus enzymogenes TaxID=2773457 RepID=UPI002811C4EB|nr:hypothetical protein [Pelagicoccus enzymogenes]